jgi:sugar lactone lactonase YvrE
LRRGGRFAKIEAVRWRHALLGWLLAAGACAERALDRPSFADGAMGDSAVEDLSASDLSSAAVLADLAGADLAHDDAGDLSPPDLLPACANIVVTTLAGNGTPGDVDGTGGATGTTEFHFPAGVTIDGAGNAYVAELYNERIRKVAPDGTTTTLTGNGMTGYVDGTGGRNGTTRFLDPNGLAIDGAGTIYVTDSGGGSVRKVAPDGATTTLAGNGGAGSVDGTGGSNGTAEFWFPAGLALDGAGNLFVADANGNRIRKVAPGGTTTTLTGNGTAGFFDGTGGRNGSTQFKGPDGVAVDGLGNVFIADGGNNRIRKVAPDGTTTTLAGSGQGGLVDGAGATAKFNHPVGLAIDGAGFLYVADSMNHAIRRVAPDGATTTLVGDGLSGFVDGDGCAAMLFNPYMLAIRGKVMIVSESSSHRVRKIQLP